MKKGLPALRCTHPTHADESELAEAEDSLRSVGQGKRDSER